MKVLRLKIDDCGIRPEEVHAEQVRWRCQVIVKTRSSFLAKTSILTRLAIDFADELRVLGGIALSKAADSEQRCYSAISNDRL